MKTNVLPALMLGVVFLATAACQTTPRESADSPIQNTATIQSYSDPQVAELTKRFPVDSTLYVFDVDNTLLENPEGQFLGSHQWYKWQRAMEGADSRKVECLLQLQGAAYLLSHLQSTEGGFTSEFVRSLQERGYAVMALTARGPQFRTATERELDANGFDFRDSGPGEHPGFPGTYKPRKTERIDAPRGASYQLGVAMLAGQHKGASLLDLLDRIGATAMYQHIVFFDDDKKNTDAMTDSLTEAGSSFAVFLYKSVDTNLSQYDLEKTVEHQDEIQEAYSAFIRREGCDI